MLESYFYSSQKDRDIFRIIEWTIMRDQPISEIDDPITRSILSVKLICSKSLRKYIFSLVSTVEEEVNSILPSKFCVMFDASSDNHIHYVALVFTYIHETGGYSEVMIACRPLLDEGYLSAIRHSSFIAESLFVYGK